MRDLGTIGLPRAQSKHGIHRSMAGRVAGGDTVSPRGSRWDGRRAAEIATRRAVMARDAGLARISAVTRWMVAGVIALSGGLAVLAAHAFHGHTIATPTAGSSPTSVQTTTTPATTTPATTTPATTTPATTTPATTTPSNLQAPAQAPVSTPSAPVVVSGGS